MTVTLYRIIDEQRNEIVADRLSYEQASETVQFYALDYPNTKFTIESYTTTRHRGLGRDPDLYND